MLYGVVDMFSLFVMFSLAEQERQERVVRVLKGELELMQHLSA